MDTGRQAELESLIEEAVAMVLAMAVPAPLEPTTSAEEGPQGLASSFLAAGSAAHAGHAAGRDYVLDPLSRAFGRPSKTFARFHELQARLRPGALMYVAGLSLFELEALAEPAPGSPLAEALVHVLGTGGRVVLGPDHRERFMGLKGGLSSRLGRALAALAALGVETSEADPRKAPRRAGQGLGRTAGYGAAGPVRETRPQAEGRGVPSGPGPALRVVTVEDLRGLSNGSVLRLAPGAIVSPLARDEARTRGISLEP